MRLRVTTSPGRGGSLLVQYKRRGVDGAQCGVRTSRQLWSPEAGDFAEETNLDEGGVERKLNRGFIKVWMRAFEVYCTLKVIDCNQHL